MYSTTMRKKKENKSLEQTSWREATKWKKKEKHGTQIF